MHPGSGLGNQLHRFVGTKCLAVEHGKEHGMVGVEHFKGVGWMTLETESINVPYDIEYPAGKLIVADVMNMTILDGEYQSEQAFLPHLEEIREWIQVAPMELPDDLCIISHRGGEYTLYPDLYLPQSYWDNAIGMMREKYPNIRFEVQTDDIEAAKKQFPDFDCIHNMEHNWRSIRYAKHLILSNSSFAIIPAHLSPATEIIAPRCWAGHNKRVWQSQDNNYKRFTYII